MEGNSTALFNAPWGEGGEHKPTCHFLTTGHETCYP